MAGSGDPAHVKCLHAHLAFAMGEGGIADRRLDRRPRRPRVAGDAAAWSACDEVRVDPAVAAARFAWEEGLARMAEPVPAPVARRAAADRGGGARRAAPARRGDVHHARSWCASTRPPPPGTSTWPPASPAASPTPGSPPSTLDAAFAAYAALGDGRAPVSTSTRLARPGRASPPSARSAVALALVLIVVALVAGIAMGYSARGDSPPDAAVTRSESVPVVTMTVPAEP